MSRNTHPKVNHEPGPQFVIANGDIYVRIDEDMYPYTVSYMRFMAGSTGADCFYIEALVEFLNQYDYMAFEEKWMKEHPDPTEWQDI